MSGQFRRQINVLHVQRATQGVTACVALPAAFLVLFQEPVRQNLNPTHFMYAAYISAWVVYIGYLLFLTRKVAKLKRETKELGMG